MLLLTILQAFGKYHFFIWGLKNSYNWFYGESPMQGILFSRGGRGAAHTLLLLLAI